LLAIGFYGGEIKMKDRGRKFDKNKLKYGLVPPKALASVVEALTHGANKYSPFNWKGVESYRYVDATYRHLESARQGDKIDKDSGLPHLALAITNLMFLLDRQLETSHNEFEYSPNKEGVDSQMTELEKAIKEQYDREFLAQVSTLTRLEAL
jgi:hypothetical protein